jgi:Magnesium chelatase, subunit ChlI
MLARRLTTIRPATVLAEALETTRIHRVAGLTGDRTTLVTTRPFRAPHHCRVRGRSRTTGCASWMNCRSSAAMSSRSCGNRSKMVS